MSLDLIYDAMEIKKVITENLLTGSAVAECMDDLASLRINIFREYPYLYDGIREDELKYLRLYMDTPEAFVISVNDSGKMIGAATDGVSRDHVMQFWIKEL
jgi:hypothetical protein